MKIAISLVLGIENQKENQFALQLLKCYYAESRAKWDQMPPSSLCLPSVQPVLARVQIYNLGELVLKHKGRLVLRLTAVQKFTWRNVDNMVWRGPNTFLITRKHSGHLFNFCVSVLDPLHFFGFVLFVVPVLVIALGRGNTNNPYSKINTAILCVFTFHSAISICDSVPKTVLFHFTPWGRTLFLGPLYRWTGLDSERHYSTHNHFYLVPSCFLLFFYSCMLTCLNAKLWGFITAGTGLVFMKALYSLLWKVACICPT